MKTSFKNLLVASSIIMSFQSFAQTSSPQVKVTEQSVQIDLPLEAKEALKKWNSDFSIFDQKNYSASIKKLVEEINPNSAPMAWVADFDNSGTLDIALLGQAKKAQFAIALMNHGKTWQVVQLERWELPNIEKTLIPASEEGVPDTEKGIPIYILPAQGEHAEKLGKKKGIQTEYYLGTAKVFEVSKDKALQVILK